MVGLVVAVAALAACDEPSRPAASPTPVRADIDTFSVSNNPTSTRGGDTVLRVMDSAGKLKIGYLSFAVGGPDTTTATGRLTFLPRQSGFALSLLNSAPFTNDTTHQNRPALGIRVGTVKQTTAGTPVSIPLTKVVVSKGRAYLAITTTSPYELEITSTEGATAARATATAPTLALTGDAATPTTSTTPVPTTQPTPGAWRLAWADEFSGTSVDTSRWNVYDEAGPWSSVESPKATTCPKAANVSVGGGILVMRTQKANGACRGGQAQSGAGLNTWGRFEQAQGRFEARVRWTHAGNYLWGGFWTHGNGGPGYDRSMGSELDVFEYIGKDAEPNISRFKPAIHFDYTCAPKCMQNVPYNGYDVTAWHTYAVEWEPAVPGDPSTTQIRFFLDGRQIAQFDRAGAWAVNPNGTKVLVQQGGWTNDNGPFPTPFGPDRAHRIVLSAWVGAPSVDAATVARGYAPAGGHADLQVDWVRVYRR